MKPVRVASVVLGLAAVGACTAESARDTVQIVVLPGAAGSAASSTVDGGAAGDGGVAGAAGMKVDGGGAAGAAGTTGGKAGAAAGTAGTAGSKADGGLPEAGPPKDAAADVPVMPNGPTRYAYGPRHSPMTAGVVAHLKAVMAAGNGRKDVFAKVGDSITVNSGFLHCFAKSDVMLGTHAGLSPAVDYFKKTLADGAVSSFDRTTLAAMVGWSAAKAVTGNPSPIEQEVAIVKPAFAVVMLGTNDTYQQGVFAFDKNLRLGVDQLLALGVVPLLSTIPPRGDKVDANKLVPEMNAIVRAIAEERGVPLMDFWQTLVGLTDYGLASDGVHPQIYVSGGAHPCWLTDAALSEGVNQRNLITLEALDRARRFLATTAQAEADPAGVAGSGSHADPFVVDSLPFVHHANTVMDGDSTWDTYSCSTANEGGNELVYRVKVTAPHRLSIRAFASDGADVDVHWLSGNDPAACVARDDRHLELDVVPGTYFLSIDTFISGGKALGGDYRLTIVPVE